MASPVSRSAWPDPTADPAVLVIRHGETEWSRTGQHTGRTDIPLTELGERQAVRAGDIARALLGDATPGLVLCSPRIRARHTAELAGFTPDRIADDAAEWDYGDYEGLTSPEIDRLAPGWSIWDSPVPQGESADDVSARFDRLLTGAAEGLRSAGRSGPVLIFSHGHAIRCIAARWLGEPIRSGRHYRLGTGAVSGLGFEHRGPVISHWNLDSVVGPA